MGIKMGVFRKKMGVFTICSRKSEQEYCIEMNKRDKQA